MAYDLGAISPEQWQSLARAYMEDSPFGSRKDRVTQQVGPSLRDVAQITEALRSDPETLARLAGKTGITLSNAQPLDLMLGTDEASDAAANTPYASPSVASAPTSSAATSKPASSGPTTGASAASDASQRGGSATGASDNIVSALDTLEQGVPSVAGVNEGGPGLSATPSRGGVLDAILGIAPFIATAAAISQAAMRGAPSGGAASKPLALPAPKSMPEMPQLSGPAKQELLSAPAPKKALPAPEQRKAITDQRTSDASGYKSGGKELPPSGPKRGSSGTPFRNIPNAPTGPATNGRDILLQILKGFPRA